MKQRTNFCTTFIAFFAVILACLMLAGCSLGGAGELNKVTSESGFVIEGKEFDKGSTLEANEVLSTSQEGKDILSTLSSANHKYDAKKAVNIYEIHIENGGKIVQPTGKVTVKNSI